MTNVDRIYLDNAATSWPKPDPVHAAVRRYQQDCGAPAGRGTYHQAMEAEREVAETRRLVAQLLGAESPDRIVFTFNGTDSLNQALHGVLRPGDHVVTSVLEHNSVLRPLRFLEETRDVSVTRIRCGAAGTIDPDDVRAAICAETKLIALIHASNVMGTIQPLSDVGAIAREHDLLFLVDAAQSLGHLPFRVTELGAHLLAAPGHKGLLGPLGTGILYIAPGIEELVQSLRQGGTGTQSDEDRQPTSMPDKFEAGNHNLPGLVGLGAAVEFLLEFGLNKVRDHHTQLMSQMIDGLSDIDKVTVFGPYDPAKRVGVVSITVRGYDPQEVASMLDAAYAIQVRSGIHCAPLAHQALGTAAGGGTVRFSPGVFSTSQQIHRVIDAVAEVAATAVGV